VVEDDDEEGDVEEEVESDEAGEEERMELSLEDDSADEDVEEDARVEELLIIEGKFWLRVELDDTMKVAALEDNEDKEDERNEEVCDSERLERGLLSVELE